MYRHPGFALVVLFACLSLAKPVDSAPVNPHISMDLCPYCHVAIPSHDDIALGEFRLLRDSIDTTCKTCHADTACALGIGQVVHPSGIGNWNQRVCDGPKTLPLYAGKITCATCHYHLKPVGADFKMVRKANFFGNDVDLSAFCADCHEDYY